MGFLFYRHSSTKIITYYDTIPIEKSLAGERPERPGAAAVRLRGSVHRVRFDRPIYPLQRHRLPCHRPEFR